MQWVRPAPSITVRVWRQQSALMSQWDEDILTSTSSHPPTVRLKWFCEARFQDLGTITASQQLMIKKHIYLFSQSVDTSWKLIWLLVAIGAFLNLKIMRKHLVNLLLPSPKHSRWTRTCSKQDPKKTHSILKRDEKYTPHILHLPTKLQSDCYKHANKDKILPQMGFIHLQPCLKVCEPLRMFYISA